MNRTGRRRAPGPRLARPLAGPLGCLLGCLLSCLLGGCATIPTSGPVVQGQAVDGGLPEGLFQVFPDGPHPGATPQEIVEGFLLAAVGFSDDHRVARSFLTSQRRLAWRPDASVVVYPGQTSLSLRNIGAATPTPSARAKPAPRVTARSGQQPDEPTPSPTRTGAVAAGEITRVEVRVPVQARIDQDGRYTLAAAGQSIVATFTLVKVKEAQNQWRISELADGILVARSDFDVTFRPYSVYFTDPSGRYLVPELHWFAGSRDEPGSRELPTALVRVLLEGPPPWLRGAVVTNVPAQTRMAVAAVVVADDVATVDLTDPVRSVTGRRRQLMFSQLEATLGQLRTISAVKITVRRLAFDEPTGATSKDPAQPAAQPLVDPQVLPQPVAIDEKGRLARLDPDTGVLTPVANVAGLAVPGANRPAVADDSSAYAVLDAERRTLLYQLPGTKALALVHSAQLSAPSFDPQGWVWTASGANPGFVYAGGVDPALIRVKAPWLKGFGVLSLRISRDGSRAALAVTVRGRAHLFVSGVVRDAEGRPQSLTDPIGQVPDLAGVRDLAWVDEDTVVLLGRRSIDPQERPWLVQIGGEIAAVAPAPGAESVAAGNGEFSLLAGTPAGSLGRVGARWQRVSTARWPAFPG